MMNRPLLRHYRLWMTLLVIVPCIVLVAIYSIAQFQSGKEESRQLLRQNVESQQRLIDYWIQERAVTVKEMSEHPAVRNLDVTGMQQAFFAKQHYDKNYDSFSFIGKDGIFRISTLPGGIRFPSAIGRPYYEMAMEGKDYVSAVVLGRNSGQLIINFASPVKDYSGNILGLILGSIRTATLTDLLSGNWLGQTGQTVLINQEGLMLTEPRAVSRLASLGLIQETAVMKLKASEGLFSQIRRGASEPAAWTDLLGNKALGYYIDVPERGWTIVGRISEAEVMASTYRQLTIMTGGVLLVLLLIFPLSYKIDKDMQTLDENATRFEAMMKQSMEAVILCDMETGRIVEVNDAAVGMFGYPKQELLSLHFNALAESDKEEHQILRQKHLLSSTVRRRCRDGGVISVERSASLIRHQSKEMALFTYRFLTEERKLQERVEKDFKRAGLIQSQLLQGDFQNDEVTVRTLFYPSQYVSGDHYGYRWSCDGNILNGFLLDVSGHGLATALQTTAIGTVCNALMATEKTWSEEVLSNLNSKISVYMAEESFASIIVFSLDVRRRFLTCIAGGINYFLVSTKDQTGWVILPGSFLGIDKTAQFGVMTFALQQGDTFYFLTDGITDRLSRTLAVDARDFETTFQMLEQLSAATDKRDDSSGLCIQFNG